MVILSLSMKKVKCVFLIMLGAFVIFILVGILILAVLKFLLVPRQIDGFGPETLQTTELTNHYDCLIEGKKVIKQRDTLSIPFLRTFLAGNKGIVYTYHLMFEGKNGFEAFLKYNTPFTSGIGAIADDIQFLIEESPENIVIYHDYALKSEEEKDVFTVEKNPFSKKVLLIYDPNLLMKKNKSGICYKGLEHP